MLVILDTKELLAWRYDFRNSQGFRMFQQLLDVLGTDYEKLRHFVNDLADFCNYDSDDHDVRFCSFADLGFDIFIDKSRPANTRVSFFLMSPQLEAARLKPFCGQWPGEVRQTDKRTDVRRKLGNQPFSSKKLLNGATILDEYLFDPCILAFAFDSQTESMLSAQLYFRQDAEDVSARCVDLVARPSSSREEHSLGVVPSTTVVDIGVVMQFDSPQNAQLSRLAIGPSGIYFACNRSVWLWDTASGLQRYAQCRPADDPISGLCLDQDGTLYVCAGTTIYKIRRDKSGGVLASFQCGDDSDGMKATDLCLTQEGWLLAAACTNTKGYVFGFDTKCGKPKLIVETSNWIQGLAPAVHGSFWCLESRTRSVVRRSLAGREIERFPLPESAVFGAELFDGALAVNNNADLYLTAGEMLFRLHNNGQCDVIVEKLRLPTGMGFGRDSALCLLEAGNSRILSIKIDG